jgi:hypothetical protein
MTVFKFRVAAQDPVSMLRSRQTQYISALLVAHVLTGSMSQEITSADNPLNPQDTPSDFPGSLSETIHQESLVPLQSSEKGCEGREFGTHPDPSDPHCYLFCPGQLENSAGAATLQNGEPGWVYGSALSGKRGCCTNLLCYQNTKDGSAFGSCGACLPVGG